MKLYVDSKPIDHPQVVPKTFLKMFFGTTFGLLLELLLDYFWKSSHSSEKLQLAVVI